MAADAIRAPRFLDAVEEPEDVNRGGKRLIAELGVLI
jgi:hypothetical protein